MEEEKHRMLYQGMDPCQTRQADPRPLSLSPSEPPTYDDAMATTEPSQAHLGYGGDRRRTFFAEPQHLRYRLEDVSYLVIEQPQLQVVPEEPEMLEFLSFSLILYLPQDFFDLAPQPKLGCRAVAIMCPACGHQGVTTVRRTPHTRTHVMALLLCTFGWCCCACLWPYLVKSCRITRHYCSACHIFLGAHYPKGCCR
ncbi:hypothetical protein KR054_004701 [Drosophila jambulina]|nr:hypothetical protein KR054_004701 [Drosophila jambulina]